MDAWRMRPRFKEKLDVDAVALMRALAEGTRAPEARFVGTVLKRHAMLTVAAAERHFWSPHLSLDVLQEEDGTKLRGRYAPHPSLWTGIMTAYAVLTMCAIAGSMYGTSQWILGRTPWALCAVPAAGLVGLAIYASAAVGQKLAEAQMEQLHAFLRDSIDRARDLGSH